MHMNAQTQRKDNNSSVNELEVIQKCGLPHIKDTCTTNKKNLKWTKCPSISPETWKLGEENKEEILQDIGITNDFAGKISKP